PCGDSLVGGPLLRTVRALAPAQGVAGTGHRFHRGGAFESGERLLRQSFGGHCPVDSADELGIWLYLEFTTAASQRVDGKRCPDANRRCGTDDPGSCSRREGDKCSCGRANMGDALPDLRRFPGSFQRLWISVDESTASPGD